MSNLSNVMRKYYIKRKNRIIFINNMSLNNLAFEIWEHMNYKGIDQSSLSRIVNGKRLFTMEQLNNFCSILKLNNDQKKDLYSALEEDYLRRYGFRIYTSNTKSIDIIDLLDSKLRQISEAREHGLLYLVNDWIDNLLEMVALSLKSEKNRLREVQLARILGDALYEKAYISGCIYLPGKNMSIVRPIASRMIRYARELRSPDLLIKAYIVLSFAYYALGKYSTTHQFSKYYLRSLSIIKRAFNQNIKSDKLSLICWRTVAINSIYSSDSSLFYKSEKKLREVIQKNKDDSEFSYIVWALDTIARGQSFFKTGDALETVRESKEFNRQIKWYDPLREASMIRNEIETLNNLNEGTELKYIQKRAKDGLVIATHYRFHRYKKLFQVYL